MQRPQALAELAIGLRARLTIRSYLPSRGLHLKRETSPDMFEGFPRLRVALPEPSPLPPATSRVPGGRANLMIYFSESRSGTLLPLSGFDRRTGDYAMHSAEKPSLYDRLGGVYSIATVVDDLIDRLMVDPRLNANPLVDEAHHRVSAQGFPQKYTGKSMVDSHAQLKITSTEWEAFLDDFQQTLDKFKVPAAEQAELRAIVNSTRADIVVDSAHPPAASS